MPLVIALVPLKFPVEVYNFLKSTLHQGENALVPLPYQKRSKHVQAWNWALNNARFFSFFSVCLSLFSFLSILLLLL